MREVTAVSLHAVQCCTVIFSVLSFTFAFTRALLFIAKYAVVTWMMSVMLLKRW